MFCRVSVLCGTQVCIGLADPRQIAVDQRSGRVETIFYRTTAVASMRQGEDLLDLLDPSTLFSANK